MTNKTCGECYYYISEIKRCNIKKITYNIQQTDTGCRYFKRKPIPKPTNGDVIRHGSDKGLVTYKHQCSCFVCIYHNEENKKCHCHRPKDKTCTDGMIAWLNAPAESE